MVVSITGTQEFVVGDTLTGSGGKTATIATIAGADVTLMFAANGSVDSYYIGGAPTPVTDPIFFLVGRRERMLNTSLVPSPTSADQDRLPNVQDLGNVWVAINSQTGLIATDVVAVATDTSSNINAAATARSLVRDLQGMGGK